MLHPKYFKDANSEKSLVILLVKEFDSIIEELEDIRIYDDAKIKNQSLFQIN